MPKLVHRVPRYRKHRRSGQAVVTINGHDVYLGPHGSRASRLEYDRAISEWLVAGRSSFGIINDSELTIVELIARWDAHARQHYRKNGRLTQEYEEFKYSLRPLRKLYGDTLARDFSPLGLKAVRTKMVEADLSRKLINQRTRRVRHFFRWAVAEELIPVEVHQRLATVEGLQRGRTEARETDPVRPVDDAVVEETLQFAGPIVGDMVRLQRFLGCRPEEVCMLRPGDIDRSGEAWVYEPMTHKMEHRGREKVIVIGPRGQQILTKYLLRPADSYCFSPIETDRRVRDARREKRRTPISRGNSEGTNRKKQPRRKPRECYCTDSYRRAIHRAVDKV